jgi:hypothetical protein
LRVSGAALLIATAAIHLDLYVTGYRTIPTIGWLFLPARSARSRHFWSGMGFALIGQFRWLRPG